MNSSSFEGEIYYSIPQVATYFNVSERTVNNWFKELVELNLIIRMQLSYNGVSFTYLQPY